MTSLYEQMISRQKDIFTSQQQEKIRNTNITVLGCGGLGGTVIEQLVRAGFENLTIIDQDVFDYTNMNRQIRSNLDTINKSKVETTKYESLKINPDLNIRTIDTTITEDNVSDILKGSDILIDAVDNVYTRVIISRECTRQKITFIHSAVEKTQGQLTVFTADTPSYEELFRLKSKDKELTDDVVGYLKNLSSEKPQVLGTTPSIFAALEVTEALKYVSGDENLLLAPKVLMWDIYDYTSFRVIEF
ncbi:MAG: HesA/MoeB/ThiF family protein [Methanosphaera stadtmanae]|nr:HesA/MoeB/ThiF family protein [Methanosphaera stadtmanae]